ncbi:hypothetical protein L8R80_13785 [Vibrio splendidus]|uniref:hypothetical protein n=1 Tax=Vibrio TaxID=662 RepID=UPI001552E668|nr:MULTISPECIES: hypothetical protein [Vibrio]MDH5911478.1 hypothetical protein [Vibrio splendidus]MDH5942737.1 hypothetical protein [Vibrio splendidus]MDH5985716.1 hypothetical protein [Vibrio splendidus]MDH5994314.1 hypothetical protein [Vibrio splendidus]MDH6005143.1 hypothetical protein [Vibrio splendidus]
MKIKRMLLTCIGALTFVASTSVFATDLAPETKFTLGKYQDKAYNQMSDNYSHYAELFNLCQQKPNDERCGQEFETKQGAYLKSKSYADILLMMLDNGYQVLPVAPVAYEDMAGALTQLGYIETGTEAGDVTYDELVNATEQWSEDHGFDKDKNLYMWQWIAMQVDANTNTTSHE